MSWHDKVKGAIAIECNAAWKDANKNWSHGKRHNPYHIPEIAKAMVTALNTDDEHEGKRLLLLHRTRALSLV